MPDNTVSFGGNDYTVTAANVDAVSMARINYEQHLYGRTLTASEQLAIRQALGQVAGLSNPTYSVSAAGVQVHQIGIGGVLKNTVVGSIHAVGNGLNVLRKAAADVGNRLETGLEIGTVLVVVGGAAVLYLYAKGKLK